MGQPRLVQQDGGMQLMQPVKCNSHRPALSAAVLMTAGGQIKSFLVHSLSPALVWVLSNLEIEVAFRKMRGQ